MVPIGRLVKVSLYIIDLQVMIMSPLSPLLSVSFCTQLVLGEGFSHLPSMLYNLTSRNGALDCLFLFPPIREVGLAFLANKFQNAHSLT